MECKLKRYYDLSESELEEMAYDRMQMYWYGIDMVEAQETLLKLKIAEYPNMEVKAKKKFNKSLEAQAYFKQEVKVIKTSDIARVLGG